MLFSVPLSEFEIDHIHYTKSKKNIIMNGLFTKILYSDSSIVLNGLFLDFPVKVKYVHNKSYYVLDEKSKSNQDMIQKLLHIENDILLYYKKIMHKTQFKSVFLLKNQMDKGIFKFMPYDENAASHPVVSYFPAQLSFILKISGIWQNESNMGLNYKVVSITV